MAVLPLAPAPGRAARYTEHIVSEATRKERKYGPGAASAGSSSPCSSTSSLGGDLRGSSPLGSPPGSPLGLGATALFSFALPARQQRTSYREQQLAVRRALSAKLTSGVTLDTHEKGVLFPVVHVCERGPPLQRFLDSGSLLDEQALGPDYVLYQGCYQEVRCIAPEGTEVAVPPLDETDQPRDFLLLGFKGMDDGFGQVMEDTWKDWTGARHIYLFLPEMLGLERISLYRRVDPANIQLFKYLVLARLGPNTDRSPTAQDVLLDYAQRLRVHRINAYLSVYTSNQREPKRL